MNVVVGSAFRNATHYLPRYFAQVESLVRQTILPMKVRIVTVEGDSCDNTRDQLEDLSGACYVPTTIVTHNHGLPIFGSTESSVRLKALSGVSNAILDSIESTDDVLLYIESDLLWEGQTIAKLIKSLLASDYDIIAPMVWAGRSFYDTWGFRKDGVRFTPGHPYHRNLCGLTEIDSAGSCLVMKASVVNNTNGSSPRSTEGALVEWCNNAREMGYQIAVNPQFNIYHP